MWQLFNCSRHLQHNLNNFRLCTTFTKSLKCTVKPHRPLVKTGKTPFLKSSLITNTGISLAIVSGGVLTFSQKVLCKSSPSRIAGYQKHNDLHLKFDWKRFWLYIKPHIWYLVAAIMGALAVALLNIQIPQIMGAVVNILTRFSDSHDSEAFFKEMKIPAMKLVTMYIAQSAFTFGYIDMLSQLGEKIAFNLKRDLFASIIKQDIAFFDVHRTGEIIHRLTVDVQEFKSSFKQAISGGLRAATQIIGSAISLVIISPQMTAMTLLCVPSVIGIGTLFGSILRQLSREAHTQIEKSTAIADEAVGNIRTVRAFAMEEQEIELFEKEAELAMELNQKLGFGIGLFQGGTNMFLNSMVLATLYVGGYLLSTNQLSAGQLMAFLMASQTIQRSLAQLSLLFGAAVRGVAAGSRIFQYLDLKPTLPLSGGEIIPYHTLKGNIEFKDVTFAYPSRAQQIILKDFNLTIPAGKTVAIVGTSGNGKSTIVALLERFYDTNTGSILLDGKDIKELDPSWLRGRVIGLISQEPILFGTTIMENIRYGRPSATDLDVREAAILANAHDFISSFPDGYNTLVGERGATLSGGQKQRVAIARALLKNPTVLVLDEATSALDTESEKIVQAALETAQKGRTVLVIAHRLTTIEKADLIVVLHKGKVVEMGTHAELTKMKGYYWSLNYQT